MLERGYPMQLASNELHKLSELIMSCFNTVTRIVTFKSQAQDEELKELLERHFPQHIQDYNKKVEFIQNKMTPDITTFKPDELKPELGSFTQAPVSNFPPVNPRLQIDQLNDREIATAYLLNQKSAAKNYAAAVVECANPDLRTFLENAFLNSSHHAYDIWQYMTKKGYYPLSAAPLPEIQKIASIYQPIYQ